MSNGTASAQHQQNGSSNEYSFGNPPPLGNPVMGSLIGTEPAPPQFEPLRKYRGDSLLQPHRMRERLQNKAPLIGYGLGFAAPENARMIASAGFDFIFVDWEHTAIGIKEVTELIRWINLTSEGNTGVIVRVPTHEHNWIAWALDAGASGIVLPHTETVEQAKAAVAAARFYTQGGHRSYPPFAMPLGINDGDHKEGALPWDIYNRSAVILQLESKKGADNAEAICAVEGVDGLMVGHMDLRFDLGLGYGGAMDEPEYLEGVGKIMAAAKKHGDLPVMSFAQGAASQEKLLQAGFRILMVGADAMDLSAGMRRQLNSAHDVVKKHLGSQQ